MRISMTRQLKVNLGNYESYSFGATVTIDNGDIGLSDQDVEEASLKDPKWLDSTVNVMRDKAEQYLDLLLIADIEAAQGITEEDRSVVLRSFTNQQQEADQPPATNQRRPRNVRR